MPFFQKKYHHREKHRMKVMVRGKVFEDVDHCAEHFDLSTDNVRRMITEAHNDCIHCAPRVEP